MNLCQNNHMCYFLYRSEDNALSDIIMSMRKKYVIYSKIMIISMFFFFGYLKWQSITKALLRNEDRYLVSPNFFIYKKEGKKKTNLQLWASVVHILNWENVCTSTQVLRLIVCFMSFRTKGLIGFGMSTNPSLNSR